ncbi:MULTISPECIES: ATP-binding protein [Vibrio harveyi group]|uniref:ATP-binding protein n=1 Tax=Vibrio harveyi group TaxID=717610 RepID=UPI001B8390B6|nr:MULTISPECIES: transporter substrate-binding domain-containing protein [Vibrio harveyi group]MBS9834900.1 transporter substrate-binding domain-containing protein [Vibrio alginolyticus]WHT05002.1 transporter substrate-binding domain-containing protein [Vibrio parahaemolyticus]HBC3983373.1 transporter substrate-binding domain-containing protein [Vibrio parahaemolyticus]
MKKTSNFRYFFLIFSTLLIVSLLARADVDHNLKLFGHDTIDNVGVQLTEEQLAWIEKHKTIHVGVSTPDYPPFDITINGNSDVYEGLSADYLQILSKILKVNIELHFFSSRDKAIAAIKAGKLDLLTTANRYEEFHDLELSDCYVEDIPVLYVPSNQPEKEFPSRIAMAYDYLPDIEVKTLFPRSEVIHYPSRQQAVAAAAFGQVDAVVVDLFSANYIVNNNFSKKLLLKSVLPINTRGISFAFNTDNKILGGIINSYLRQLPKSEHWIIKKRWSGGGITPPTKLPIKLNEAERKWLKQHQNIRVIVNQYNAPISFFDDNNNLRGFTADLLEVVTLYTGMTFSIIKTKNFKDLQEKLRNHGADLTVLAPSEERKKEFLFSKEFVKSNYVFISRKEDNLFSNKANLRLALPNGHIAEERIKNAMPQAQLILTESYLEAMEFIRKGKADAAIATLGVADYYINYYFDEQLKIDSVIEQIPSETAAFSTTDDNRELINILNKVLTTLPVDELQSIEKRWRLNKTPGEETWRDYKYTIYAIIISSAILITVSLLWAKITHGHYIKTISAKRALREQLIFMQEILDSIPHPIYVRNLSQQLILCNKNYVEVFKISKENILYTSTLHGLDHLEEIHKLRQLYKQAILQNRAFYCDRKMNIDGQSIDCYHWFQPFKDSLGNTQGIVGGWIDVSDRVQLMQELTKAKNAADSASKAKTQFLATMSHEIRTPMNAIIGLLELSLERTNHNQFDFDSIQVAYDSAKDLLALIGDILDIVRIESGELHLNPTPVEIKSTIESVLRIFKGIATQKNLILKLDFDNELPQNAVLDSQRIKQILSNLIGNALKFTENGHVIVRVSKGWALGEEVALVLEVADTGVGISLEEQKKLFRPFSQANHGTHNKGGTGLGLSICKSLCELMGGTLYMRSNLGEGTSVTASIPLVATGIKERETNSSQDLDKVAPKMHQQSILIVDDHPANRLLLSQQLKHLGHTVEEVDNGIDALRLYSQYAYKIVITDCNMPEMDGYEFSRRLRTIEQNKNLPPTVLLGYTANAQLETKDKCIKAGMNDCLFKPIGLEELQQTLNNFKNILEKESPQSSFLPTTILTLTGNDKELAEQLLCKLLKTNDKDIVSLKLAFQNEDLHDIRSIAHRLKGAAKIISASKVVTICEQLEKIEEIEEGNPYLLKLISATDHLEKEIEQYLSTNDYFFH